MISTAIQSTLAAIIPNTYFAMGDEEIITPYCVHKESGVPEYLKEGITGYNYGCEVVIIDDTPEKVESLVQLTKNAVLALDGTTVSGTSFNGISWEGDEPDYDPESKMYINILRFEIFTLNR